MKTTINRLATFTLLFAVLHLNVLAQNTPTLAIKLLVKVTDSNMQKFGHFSPLKGKNQSIKNNYLVLSYADSADMKMDLAKLNSDDQIAAIEFNHQMSVQGSNSVQSNDGHFYKQWGLKNRGDIPFTSSKEGADIQMEEAWALQKGDTSVVVAVIDSGIKLDHPDFQGRIWRNYAEIPSNGLDDDGNGYIDDFRGWDFCSQDNNPSDDSGHGTNVASIIGANTNNAYGFSGVDWKCKLMILKVLNNDLGEYAAWIESIYYAVDNGANVLNMSLGGDVNSDALNQAIQYALDRDVVVVVSMGNANSSQITYPSNYPGVIAVGATNPDDTRVKAFFWSPQSGSNFGDHISVVAPGNYIYGLNYLSNTGFNTYYGGTSQAAAYVSGLASLLKAQKKDRTNQQIKELIERTAEDQVGNSSEDVLGKDIYYGYGRINAFRALEIEDPNPQFNLAAEDVTVYPNPASDFVTIQFPAETELVELINMNGYVLSSVNVSETLTTRFTLEEKGIFLLKITARGQQIAKKLIVN